VASEQGTQHTVRAHGPLSISAAEPRGFRKKHITAYHVVHSMHTCCCCSASCECVSTAECFVNKGRAVEGQHAETASTVRSAPRYYNANAAEQH